MWQHPLRKLPDIMQIPISGNSTQSCLDAFLCNEEVYKNCPNCKSTRSLKSLDITLSPSTLILQIMRFSFDVSKKKSRKLHMPINCTTTLSLKNCGMYQLNSVINHIGESSTSGHYNIMFNDLENKQFILVDDTNIDYDSSIDVVKDMCYVVSYTKM